MLKIKRVYDDESQQDGKRYLVDGVWPRGVKKEDLDHDEWYKELSPSSDLRKWFNHDAGKWENISGSSMNIKICSRKSKRTVTATT